MAYGVYVYSEDMDDAGVARGPECIRVLGVWLMSGNMHWRVFCLLDLEFGPWLLEDAVLD